MLSKIKIEIKGSRVQEVGYRPFLLINAINLGISNIYAYNLKEEEKEKVIVLVSGEESKLNTFLDFVKSNYPENAEIETIWHESYEGEVMKSSDFLQILQFEQINKGIPAILDIRNTLKSVKQDTSKMLEKQDKMLEKQDKMLEKQDKMLEKQDKMLEKQDETLDEIKALRGDLKSYLEMRFEKIEREIAIIKKKIGISV